MIRLNDFISDFPLAKRVPEDMPPWVITARLSGLLVLVMHEQGMDFNIKNQVAIHRTATIEKGAVIKPPAIIGAGCFIACGAYLRGGVFLGESVTIGPGCEIKSSFISSGTAVAHFNFIGDSMIGSHVNFEAGSVVANHYNERENKRILVLFEEALIDTGSEKFGALVGDHSKIGANAVLSPGTILKPLSVVKRLELIEQV
jgi:NDP-sugar pyrophosphorylase family protein